MRLDETESGYSLLSGKDINKNEILQVSKAAIGSAVKFYLCPYFDFGAGKAMALDSTENCL
ncbi:hypothetical protein KW869_20685 [Pseudomonas urmiensis]|uniref:Uncharacterized protein n=1 Tax=Pseudomonas urmiensis TaxID=2745493 RepID=A0ABW8P1E2_9PSED